MGASLGFSRYRKDVCMLVWGTREGMKLERQSGARPGGVLKARVKSCNLFQGQWEVIQRLCQGSDRIQSGTRTETTLGSFLFRTLRSLISTTTTSLSTLAEPPGSSSCSHYPSTGALSPHTPLLSLKIVLLCLQECPLQSKQPPFLLIFISFTYLF